MTRILRPLGVVVVIDDSLQKRFFEKLTTNRKNALKTPNFFLQKEKGIIQEKKNYIYSIIVI